MTHNFPWGEIDFSQSFLCLKKPSEIEDVNVIFPKLLHFFDNTIPQIDN